jgi:hypothetical protein
MKKTVSESSKTGNSIVQDLSSKGNNIKFKRLDASLISECKTFVKDLNQESIDYLIITAGIMRLGGRQETSEGLDYKMVLHYYSRFALINECLPLLEKAAKENGEARIMSVLHAGGGRLVNESDLDLKQHYGIKSCADACTFYNDLMVDVRIS